MIPEVKLFDLVALLRDLPGTALVAGNVGTIVEVLSDGDAYLVEFGGASGETFAIEPLRPQDFLVLRYEPQSANVSG
ncbi:MAG: DUF4926 domain-containing protein [Candidatus Hydrogenedentota bacterium]